MPKVQICLMTEKEKDPQKTAGHKFGVKKKITSWQRAS